MRDSKKEGIICPYVFHRLRGKKRGQQIKTLNTTFKKAVEAAGLPHKVFHDMRRTGTRDIFRAGNSEAVTMMFTGHKTRAMFDRYNLISMKDMRAGAARVDARISRSGLTCCRSRSSRRSDYCDFCCD